MNELDYAFTLLEPFTPVEWLFISVCFLILLWLAYNDSDRF